MDVWFTNIDTSALGDQQYTRGRPPRTIWSQVKVFDKAKDQHVILVVVLNDARNHTIAGTLKGLEGTERPYGWSVASATNFGTWRASSYRWAVASLAPGKYVVDVVVDDERVGNYDFEVK